MANKQGVRLLSNHHVYNTEFNNDSTFSKISLTGAIAFLIHVRNSSSENFCIYTYFWFCLTRLTCRIWGLEVRRKYPIYRSSCELSNCSRSLMHLEVIGPPYFLHFSKLSKVFIYFANFSFSFFMRAIFFLAFIVSTKSFSKFQTIALSFEHLAHDHSCFFWCSGNF